MISASVGSASGVEASGVEVPGVEDWAVASVSFAVVVVTAERAAVESMLSWRLIVRGLLLAEPKRAGGRGGVGLGGADESRCRLREILLRLHDC